VVSLAVSGLGEGADLHGHNAGVRVLLLPHKPRQVRRELKTVVSTEDKTWTPRARWPVVLHKRAAITST